MVEMDGSAEGIVFSQFKPFLDLIQFALQKSGVNSVIFDGLTTLRKDYRKKRPENESFAQELDSSVREAAVTRFREDPNCRTFLTTFKAGGVALNLPVASHFSIHIKLEIDDTAQRPGLAPVLAPSPLLTLPSLYPQVFLMNPLYNPAVEWQTQDRVHRIGQLKPVRVVRFIMKNTIEEMILEFRKKKELRIEGTVGRSSKVVDKLSEDDNWWDKPSSGDIWSLFK
ncbi:hypothetical protein BUALT_Bualt18G0013800 [Buddleja alternifolia]|uniref:Helicase C-terminal domain-containing protein n=1 Tax=Buddleja alternifolia TaxID=168488 RepID=A0AAV6W831_9LAMI|nr:hypothetical protein BUALT_Bualt18G0013800 [Buddleja alternifolia]